MQVLERTFALIALAGFLMRVLLLPFGDEVLLIGCTLAATFYFYLAFAALNHVRLGAIFKKASYSNIGAGRILGAVAMGVFLSTIIIGIQFRLLLLHGGTEMVTIGGTALTMILPIALILMIIKKRTSDPFYHGVLIRGGLALLIGIVVVLVPERNWISLFHRDDPTYRDLFIKTRENPRDQEAREEFENYQLKADSAR